MGIRFRCHHCEHELNLKEFQGGRRARCPACSGRFRVPTASADFSIPLDESEDAANGSATSAAVARGPAFELQQPDSDPEAHLERAVQQRAAAATSSSRHAVATVQTATSNAKTRDVGRTPGLPMAVAEAPQAVWYVRPPGGGQYGPADGNVFYQWLTDQRVSPDSLVWRDGWPQWLVAGEALEDFFGTAWRVPADATTEGGAEESSAHTAAPGDITVTDVSKTVTDVVVDPRIDADIRRATTAAIAAQSGATGTVVEAAPMRPTSTVSTTSTAANVDPNATTSSVALARKKKQRTQYTIMIAVLAILACALVGVLLFVLNRGA